MEKGYVPIKGFDGYIIHKKGVIKSCWGRQIIRDSTTGRIVKSISIKMKRWQSIKGAYHKYGYSQVVLRKKNNYCCKSLHRLLAENFIQNPENKPYVCHKDGNPLNNSLGNLYWGSASENGFDAARHGTAGGFKNRGENQHQAKLTSRQVKVIKYLKKINPKLSNKKIGELFDVSYNTIGDILRQMTWKHIKI